MDKVKSKEDILWSFPQGESEPYGHVPTKRIYEAMETYATQQSRIDAIGFAEWIKDNHYTRNLNSDNSRWYKYFSKREDLPSGVSIMSGVSEYFTSEALYELYLLSNKEQDKPVLFTTEDGVEYRDSLTDYYEVRDFKHSGRCNGMSWYRPENGNKYFSTSEAAEQYILENKPFLSIKDIEIMANYKTNFKFELSKSELYHYAKQKLNK